MSTWWYLVSDSAREGYCLGNGDCGDDQIFAALRQSEPYALLLYVNSKFGYAFPPTPNQYEYVHRVVIEILAFTTAHPDWRRIDDATSDIDVVDEPERAQMIADDGGAENTRLPIYRLVGTRYKK